MSKSHDRFKGAEDHGKKSKLGKTNSEIDLVGSGSTLQRPAISRQ